MRKQRSLSSDSNTMNALKQPSEQHSLQSLIAGLAVVPSHDPTRFETTDGFDNPKCTNKDRASYAAAALESFQEICGMEEDVETAVSDLISDLFHLLHANNRDPLTVLHHGIHAFLCEAGEIRPIRDHS